MALAALAALADTPALVVPLAVLAAMALAVLAALAVCGKCYITPRSTSTDAFSSFAFPFTIFFFLVDFSLLFL